MKQKLRKLNKYRFDMKMLTTYLQFVKDNPSFYYGCTLRIGNCNYRTDYKNR